MKTISFYRCQDCDSVRMELSRGKQKCAVPSNLLLMPQVEEEASKTEKHKPVFAFPDAALSVTVGSVPHPMTEEHRIEWIYVQTKTGGIVRLLSSADAPKAVFAASKDEVVGIYAYCNLHGLWKATLEEISFHETVCSAEFPQGCIDS